MKLLNYKEFVIHRGLVLEDINKHVDHPEDQIMIINATEKEFNSFDLSFNSNYLYFYRVGPDATDEWIINFWTTEIDRINNLTCSPWTSIKGGKLL